MASHDTGKWLVVNTDPATNDNISTACMQALSYGSVFLPLPGTDCDICEFSENLPITMLRNNSNDHVDGNAITMVRDMSGVDDDHIIRLSDDTRSAGTLTIDLNDEQGLDLMIGNDSCPPDRYDEYIGIIANIVVSMTTHEHNGIMNAINGHNILEWNDKEFPDFIINPI